MHATMPWAASVVLWLGWSVCVCVCVGGGFECLPTLDVALQKLKRPAASTFFSINKTPQKESAATPNHPGTFLSWFMFHLGMICKHGWAIGMSWGRLLLSQTSLGAPPKNA